MKFLYIVLIGFLMIGCTPPIGQMTPTPTPAAPVITPTPTSAAPLTPTTSSTDTETLLPEATPSWLVQVTSRVAAPTATKSQPACSMIYKAPCSPQVITLIQMEPLKSMRTATIHPGGVTRNAPTHPREIMIITPRTARVILDILAQEQASPGRVITVMSWGPGTSLF